MIDQTIAHYKITSKLGQGGMGEVYRATDTKLDRDVAIKILPESFVGDRNRVARFEREAKALAALNHANIAAIYGVEQSGQTHALVMELIEGETLGQRLKREPMTVTEALECCKQIAEALEAAHEKGIIHRDLKPENVKITEDGHVKVLDFGLAKEVVDPSSEDQAESPTITHMTTIPGELLGTAPYMSPEQARAKPVDKRSDIWSFGCVLYECLTGKPMFRGEDVTETLASIIKGEPDWDALPEDTPPTIELLLRKCLNKDRKRRLHDIADARIDIEQALGDPTSSMIRLGAEARQQVYFARRVPWVWIGLTLVLVILLVLAIIWPAKPTAPPPSVHAELILPGSSLGFLALSPGGNLMAFDLGGVQDPITLRHLDRQGFAEIPGTTISWAMSFSPDGQAICYSNADNLWRVALDGSRPVAVAPIFKSFANPGCAWSDAGDIIYAEGRRGGLLKVPAAGGEPDRLTHLKPGETWHRWPQCLPASTQVLFTVAIEDAQSGQQIIKGAIGDLATGQHHTLPLEDNCVYVRYAQSGHLLYVNNGILFAVPFDLDRMTSTGPKKDMIQGVAANATGGLAYYDIAKSGTLVYRPSTTHTESKSTLKWLHPDGLEELIITVEGSADDCELSPDDRYVAMKLEREADDHQEDIWILELARKIPIRLTDNPGDDDNPFWSADGEWIYFKSEREGRWGIWRKRADAPASSADFIWEHDGQDILLSRLSRGGSHFTYGLSASSMDVWAVRLDEPNPRQRKLIGTSASEAWSAVSPDGKWLAFSSDTTGKREIYLTSFEDPNGQIHRVTTGGGFISQWSSSGDRLFFSDWFLTRGEAIWSVDVSIEGQTISTSVPQVFVRLTEGIRNWSIDSNGERVLAIANQEDEYLKSKGVDDEHTFVHVVTNFFAELNEKAPPSR